jgi:hypothetical protein
MSRWAHNPEVAGSNPAPRYQEVQVSGLIAGTAVGPLDRSLAVRWRDETTNRGRRRWRLAQISILCGGPAGLCPSRATNGPSD